MFWQHSWICGLCGRDQVLAVDACSSDLLPAFLLLCRRHKMPHAEAERLSACQALTSSRLPIQKSTSAVCSARSAPRMVIRSLGTLSPGPRRGAGPTGAAAGRPAALRRAPAEARLGLRGRVGETPCVVRFEGCARTGLNRSPIGLNVIIRHPV